MSEKTITFKAADFGGFVAAKNAAKAARGESGKNFSQVKQQNPDAEQKIIKTKKGYDALVPRK